jgi:hypothetical protein
MNVMVCSFTACTLYSYHFGDLITEFSPNDLGGGVHALLLLCYLRSIVSVHYSVAFRFCMGVPNTVMAISNSSLLRGHLMPVASLQPGLPKHHLGGKLRTIALYWQRVSTSFC